MGRNPAKGKTKIIITWWNDVCVRARSFCFNLEAQYEIPPEKFHIDDNALQFTETRLVSLDWLKGVKRNVCLLEVTVGKNRNSCSCPCRPARTSMNLIRYAKCTLPNVLNIFLTAPVLRKYLRRQSASCPPNTITNSTRIYGEADAADVCKMPKK